MLRTKNEEVELQLGRARDERIVAKEELQSVELNLRNLASERDRLGVCVCVRRGGGGGGAKWMCLCMSAVHEACGVCVCV